LSFNSWNQRLWNEKDFKDRLSFAFPVLRAFLLKKSVYYADVIGVENEFKDTEAAKAEYPITVYVFMLIKGSFTKMRRKLTSINTAQSL